MTSAESRTPLRNAVSSILAAVDANDDSALKSDGYFTKYLDYLRESIKEARTNQSRTLFSMLGVMAVFMLLIVDRLSDFRAFGVTLSNTDVVVAALPIVVAFLWYQLAYVGTQADLFGQVYEQFVYQRYPELASAALAPLAFPRAHPIFSHATRGFGYRRGLDVGAKLAYGVSYLLLLVLPTAFLIYAYISLWDQLQAPSALWFVSFALAIVIVVRLIAVILSEAQFESVVVAGAAQVEKPPA